MFELPAYLPQSGSQDRLRSYSTQTFIDLMTLLSDCIASNTNEYQEYFLGVKRTAA